MLTVSDKRRGLGRGLGALIPTAPATTGASRPSDVFFPEAPSGDGFTGNNHASVPDAAAGTDGSTSEGAAGHGTAEQHVRSTPAGAVGSGRSDGFTGNIADGADHEASVTPSSELAAVPGAQFAELDVLSIRPNPRQPRTVFDEDDLAELVHSVREIGVLQPIVVRAIDAEDVTDDGVRFELIMGERRLRATREAGLSSIPAIIRSTSDDDLLRDALLENLHRSQLNPLEEAAAYQQLLDDFACTHEQLAGRIGRSRPQITNTMRLLKLPPLVQRRVAAGVLSAGHARALLGLPDAAAMERLAQRIVAEGLSVRSTEEIVALGGDSTKPKNIARSTERDPRLDDLAASLSDRLDTRVNIAMGKRRGKLTVEFAGVDDLERILGQLSAK
ncbi:ParB family chromosome partitioning protein [Rudaeicoccus suwonensis]|uniref:ParB family chromosome partitioning protein n=1 Tax=Rudaeicoccus suwonensis TaxID=657409 RepID=A0A561E406_9MICO|nr:ParB family chromosome partitioning protein [Rudaeicoccus suwonensis]